MAGELLLFLLLGGLMGLLGQGARAVVGLKTAGDYADLAKSSMSDVFNLARLTISLVVGVLAGIVTALVMYKSGNDTIPASIGFSTLLSFAAAGYIGVDTIEGFMSVNLTNKGAGASTGAAASPDAQAAASPSSYAASPGVGDQLATVQAQLASLTSGTGEHSLPVLNAKIDALTALAATPAPGPLPFAALVDPVTPALAKKMFPATDIKNIARNLPFVLDGLRKLELTDKEMLNMALSTIRAETESFQPIPEGRSRFNTAQAPFDLYEPGTRVGQILGNTQVGDGARFKGRGYVQLTGRDNYRRVGNDIGLDLCSNPDLACDPATAGLILARFLKNHETTIRDALRFSNLKMARRAVNGGENGFDRFESAYRIGLNVLPPEGLDQSERRAA